MYIHTCVWLQESDGTVHVNEIERVLRLGLVRTGGSFGQVSVSWRATEGSALGNGVDYETDSGVVTFQDLEVCTCIPHHIILRYIAIFGSMHASHIIPY